MIDVLALSAGLQATAIALSALWIGLAIVALVVRRSAAAGASLVRVQMSLSGSYPLGLSGQGFWLLILLLASGLPSEIGKVLAAHHATITIAFGFFPLLTAIVIFELLRFRSWAKAQPETSRPG